MTSSIQVIKGRTDGPRIGIMALCHGDEFAGLSVHTFLKKYFSAQILHSGEIVLLKGNLRAWNAGTRCVQYDMNRLFLPDNDPGLGNIDREAYDFRRSRELLPILESLDYFLDIHNTTRPSVPFSLSMSETPEHTRLAAGFPVDVFVSGFKGRITGSSCDWVDNNGGVGIAVECGYLHDMRCGEIAVTCCKLFLSQLGVSTFVHDGSLAKCRIRIIHHEMVRDKNTFLYTRAFQNFDIVNSGELIARDSQYEYYAPQMQNLRIVFPVSIKAIREGSKREVFFLGLVAD